MAGKVGCLGEGNRRSIRSFAHGTGFSVKCAKAAEFPHSTVANFVKKRVLSANCTTPPAMAPFPPVFQFRRTRNLGMAPKSAGNLRAEASSEDLEGVKYIHSQRVMGRTGDTRRCPRPPSSAMPPSSGDAPVLPAMPPSSPGAVPGTVFPRLVDTGACQGMRVDGPQFRRPPIPAWPPIPQILQVEETTEAVWEVRHEAV